MLYIFAEYPKKYSDSSNQKVRSPYHSLFGRVTSCYRLEMRLAQEGNDRPVQVNIQSL